MKTGRAIEKQKAVYWVLMYAWIYLNLKVNLVTNYGN
jgi:hypothetical protein